MRSWSSFLLFYVPRDDPLGHDGIIAHPLRARCSLGNRHQTRPLRVEKARANRSDDGFVRFTVRAIIDAQVKPRLLRFDPR